MLHLLQNFQVKRKSSVPHEKPQSLTCVYYLFSIQYRLNPKILIYYQELNLLSLDMEALIQSYLERSVDEVTGSHLWICRQCGKTSAKLGNLKDHIEANHIEGLKLVCHLCMRSCKSSAGLRMHKARYHKDIL